MDKLRIAMCDDEEQALSIISVAVAATFKRAGVPVEISRFLRADRLLGWLDANACHIIMLDIRMPQADGIRLAEKLRQSHPDAKVVFVSNEESRVFEAFSVNAFFFIRKSRVIEDVTAFCDHYLATLHKNRERQVVSFRQNGAALSMYPGDIVYVESEGHRQKLWLADKKEPVELSVSMQAVEAELADCGFIRVHKGYLVNNSFIARISGEEILLRDGTRVPISRRRLQEVHAEHMRLTRAGNTMLR